MAAMERFNDMRRDLIELKRKVAALEGGNGEEKT